MPVAIRIEGLTKRYGSLTAVSSLDLEVHEGEILAFLGRNGAGKTTTVRVLLDLLRPTSGRAMLFGHDCQADGLAARKRIGYLPGETGFHVDMTGVAVLNLLAAMQGRPVDAKRRSELAERLRLSDADLRRKLREYSTGMKRKLGLIQAFQSDPDLLILDEPTEGLDPIMQEASWELFADTRRRGRTIFFSSHVLSEVSRVCDRVALMRQGELVLLSSVDECLRRAARTVRVTFTHDVPPPRGHPAGVELTAIEPREWNLRLEGPMGPLLRSLAALPVADVEVSEAKLEDVVLDYYRGSGERGPGASRREQAS